MNSWFNILRICRAGLLAGLPLALAVAANGASPPAMYAIDFLGAASRGVDMNEGGDAVGVKSIDVGCGSRCLAPSEEVVWSGENVIALPYPAGWDAIRVAGINASRWVVGTAQTGPDTCAVVWKPAAGGYQAIVLGPLPGFENSQGIAIDDRNRVLGTSSTPFPLASAPFVWTESGGFTALTDLGFPSYAPRAMSPGGTVAYLYGWYQLDVPGVVHQNTSPPSGFRGPGWYVAINDAGDQIRLLLPTSSQNINYPFRYYNTGEWQQIWPQGGIDASPFGVGSITSGLDISLTIRGTGLLAPGPAGLAEDLTTRLSPAYGDAYVTEAGPMNERGEILGAVMIGRSPRLVRMVEANGCTSGCIRIAAIDLTAKNPKRCNGGSMRAQASVLVVDENGRPLRGVQVTGRFLDNYWLDGVRQGTTDRKGKVRFSHSGPPCVGAVTFLVTGATGAGRSFDRTSGTLQRWKIPG